LYGCGGAWRQKCERLNHRGDRGCTISLISCGASEEEEEKEKEGSRKRRRRRSKRRRRRKRKSNEVSRACQDHVASSVVYFLSVSKFWHVFNCQL